MSTTTDNNGQRFRTLQQYKNYFAPTPEEPEYDYSEKSEDYKKGAELARKAFAAVKQRIEEEKKLPPWQKPPKGS